MSMSSPFLALVSDETSNSPSPREGGVQGERSSVRISGFPLARE
jgi:hypothetical protein